MAAATRICKICGKEYEYCHTEGHKNIFRWQDVACSPEHGSEYFARILKSRMEQDKVDEPKEVIEDIEIDIDDDEDEDMFEDDYEDEDDDE